MEMKLLTPKRGSSSGTLLARALGIHKLSGKRLQQFVGSKDTIVINWGNSEPNEEVMKCTLLNHPEAIKSAINKKTALSVMEIAGVRVPEFTYDEAVANKWVDEGNKVVARHTLTGSGGEGIQILVSPNDFPCEAPLYTKYIPKKSEFRFHVLDGKIFDIQRKMRRRDVPDDEVNWQIRNHINGFIFGRRDGPLPKNMFNQLSDLAKMAVSSLGLDFGAVDIIWNDKQQKAFVLEVNTAPGLEGETAYRYQGAFLASLYRRQNPQPRIRPPTKFLLDDNFKILNLEI